MLLPPNMLDWVPEGHAVRVVIGAVERLVTRGLIDRLVPAAPKGSAAGPARYDPVMLLTVWMYAYLRGVLSTRAVEDRCRYDATFRVACGRAIPDHTTFSRFRRHLFAQAGLAEDLFYRVLHVCAQAGLGRLSVVAGDGVKIAANASKEASRTEAGLRKLAGQVMADARKAADDDEADKAVLPGTDLLLGAETLPAPDPRSRAGRVLACLEDLQGEREAAEAEAAASADGAGNAARVPQRNVTDPDSRLMPVRGGGFIQGYNCQDAAADDRLMLGGYACQDTGDALQAQQLAAVAEKGAAVVAAAHAAHAASPAALRACHDRMCALPDKDRHDPGHDAAACHHAMTSGIGVLVSDAGYHSEANLTAPGPDRLIADGKTRDLARREPAEGPPPAGATAVEANAHRLRTPEGRAAYKRRAPDVEGLHASLKDRIGLRRFSLRGLDNATSEFLFAGLACNLRLLAAIS